MAPAALSELVENALVQDYSIHVAVVISNDSNLPSGYFTPSRIILQFQTKDAVMRLAQHLLTQEMPTQAVDQWAADEGWLVLHGLLGP